MTADVAVVESTFLQFYISTGCEQETATGCYGEVPVRVAFKCVGIPSPHHYNQPRPTPPTPSQSHPSCLFSHAPVLVNRTSHLTRVRNCCSAVGKERDL